MLIGSSTVALRIPFFPSHYGSDGSSTQNTRFGCEAVTHWFVSSSDSGSMCISINWSWQTEGHWVWGSYVATELAGPLNFDWDPLSQIKMERQQAFDPQWKWCLSAPIEGHGLDRKWFDSLGPHRFCIVWPYLGIRFGGYQFEPISSCSRMISHKSTLETGNKPAGTCFRSNIGGIYLPEVT